MSCSFVTSWIESVGASKICIFKQNIARYIQTKRHFLYIQQQEVAKSQDSLLAPIS